MASTTSTRSKPGTGHLKWRRQRSGSAELLFVLKYGASSRLPALPKRRTAREERQLLKWRLQIDDDPAFVEASVAKPHSGEPQHSTPQLGRVVPVMSSVDQRSRGRSTGDTEILRLLPPPTTTMMMTTKTTGEGFANWILFETTPCQVPGR